MEDYESLLRGKYPAKQHAKRVADLLRSQAPELVDGGVIYLESSMTKILEDNDEPQPFRQRRSFFYLSGVPLADSCLTYEIAKDKLTLYIPPIKPDSVIWSGRPLGPDEALQRYDIDEVKSTAGVNASLAYLGTTITASGVHSTVFAIPHHVSEQITFLSFDDKNFSLLQAAIDRARVIKDAYELAMMTKANAISSEAYALALSKARHARNECEIDAVFLAHCVAAGTRKQPYHSIVAAGEAAATLHYIRNDAPLAGKLNVLLDAAAEWDCYAADITRCFPLTGKFTSESRAIYDIVLRMQTECISMLRPGIVWDEVHTRAHEVAIEGLLALGLLRGAARADILAARTSVAFFPHGLGHYLGMDTHDPGGNPNYDDPDPMFRYLRVRGQVPEGAVITVEPGIYFCRFIIEPYLKDPKHARFIDKAELEKYWAVGGVRIEDNLIITADGSRNLTKAVKHADEIERIMAES